MTKILAILAAAILAQAAYAGDAPAAGQHRQEKLAAYDTDKDGKLSPAEREAARAARQAQFKENHPKAFAKIDSNGDGTISQAERQAHFKAKAPELFAKVDTNGDGTISQDERKAARELIREARSERRAERKGAHN